MDSSATISSPVSPSILSNLESSTVCTTNSSPISPETLHIERRRVEIDSEDSLVRRLEEVGIEVPTDIRNMWRTQTGSKTDPNLSTFMKTPIQTQKICFQHCIFGVHSYSSQSAKFWKILGIKRCVYSRSSTRKKCEHFWSLVFAFPTLFKWEMGTTPSVGGTTPWSINDTCRLMHLFLEVDLQESISRIYQGLQNREELDSKVLRKSPWIHLRSKFLDTDWKPEPPEAWIVDVHGGGGDYESVDPAIKPNIRSSAELVDRWKWIRKGCTILWNNWNKSGRYSEEDLHVWSFCSGEVILLYAFRLFDGTPAESMVRRSLPKHLQMDSGITTPSPSKRDRDHTGDLLVVKTEKKKKKNNIIHIDCTIEQTETDKSIQQMANGLTLDKFTKLRESNTFDTLDKDIQQKIKDKINSLILAML